MAENTSNNSKGCLSWFKGLGGALAGLLTIAASCAGIMQYIESSGQQQAPASNSVNVVVVTSQPVSNAQANSASISPEDWQAIEGFLREAVIAEITAYQYGDPSYATMFYGDALQAIQDQILDLNTRGVLRSAYFDYENSYIRDIRVGQNNQIEVDSCEYWANDYYERSTGSLIGSDQWMLVPQTITIEYLNANFYITSVSFHTGQAFC
jgi:hypothetical protein